MMNKNSEKTRARKYRKSLLPRLRWTPQLHHHFVEAVHNLGGKHKATPKKIMQTMAVKGLKISHIKSHLQMYRSEKESTNSNEFIAIKNYYQEKKPNLTTWLPLRQICQGSREPPPHRKQVNVPYFTCHARRKINQKGTNVICQEYQVEGAQRSSTSAITKGSGEISRKNTELQGTSEINFLGLGNHIVSDIQSCSTSSINLELTMSSH